MAYDAKILLDSISPAGYRLTSMCVTYPRFVHSEFMTHRVFSRNAASSRAIPISKMIEQVRKDPVLPVWWGKNQSGMQAKEELTGGELERAKKWWLGARENAISTALFMSGPHINLHKQLSNRLLEPWMWITVIVSATEWENFFALRCHPDAQLELQKIAYMMQDLYRASNPIERNVHLPLVVGYDEEELEGEGVVSHDLMKISTGRCARVSYLTHEGKRDSQADIDLHDRLMTSGHWSPFEHVATAMEDWQAHVENTSWSGNFRGWRQYRKQFEGENRGPK